MYGKNIGPDGLSVFNRVVAIDPKTTHKDSCGNDFDFIVNQDALYRKSDMNNLRCIITKEEFVACYNEWIKDVK